MIPLLLNRFDNKGSHILDLSCSSSASDHRKEPHYRQAAAAKTFCYFPSRNRERSHCFAVKTAMAGDNARPSRGMPGSFSAPSTAGPAVAKVFCRRPG